jgi:hypothetical protein
LRTVVALAIAVVLVACGGGGGAGSVGGGVTAPATPGPTATATAPGSTASQSTAEVTFTVTVPASSTIASAKRRVPAYISSGIASIDFRLTAVVPANNTAYTGTLNTDTLVAVTLGSPNCVVAANGDNTCTATAIEPAPATDTFTVYTYAVTNPVVGTTVPLSVYAGYSLGVTATGTNTATVATDGVPATIAFSPAVVDNVPGGTPLSGSTALTTSLQVTDASGATMIGNSNFASPSGQAGPVNFTGCDPHLTPTPASISAASPAALGAGTISIAYDGQLTSGTIHCYAIGPGGLAAQYTVNLAAANSGGGITIIIPAAQPVICTPSPVTVGANQRIVISCTSQGYAGPISSTVADPTIANVQLAAGTYTLFYVSGVAAGTTTASFATNSGGSGQVTITVTP